MYQWRTRNILACRQPNWKSHHEFWHWCICNDWFFYRPYEDTCIDPLRGKSGDEIHPYVGNPIEKIIAGFIGYCDVIFFGVVVFAILNPPIEDHTKTCLVVIAFDVQTRWEANPVMTLASDRVSSTKTRITVAYILTINFLTDEMVDEFSLLVVACLDASRIE